MASLKLALPACVIWCLFLTTRAQLPCHELLAYHHTNRSIEFSMVGRRNQTGHWITQFQFNKASQRLENNWKVDLKQSVAEYGGVYSFHINGVFTVPPPLPMDYELVPGIGFYKFHHEDKASFSDALAACAKEGGHLAIINSDEESNAIKAIYDRNSQTGRSFMGFYDQTKKREYVTIYGQPLSESGFIKWHPMEPSIPNAFCGAVLQTGLLGTAVCEEKMPFFCEYDYSWSLT